MLKMIFKILIFGHGTLPRAIGAKPLMLELKYPLYSNLNMYIMISMNMMNETFVLSK